MELNHMEKGRNYAAQNYSDRKQKCTLLRQKIFGQNIPDIFTLALIMSQHTPPRQEVKMTALT